MTFLEQIDSWLASIFGPPAPKPPSPDGKAAALSASASPPSGASKPGATRAVTTKSGKVVNVPIKRKGAKFGAAPSKSAAATAADKAADDREIEGYVYKMMIAYKVSVQKGNYDQRFEKIWNIFIFDFQPIYDSFPDEIKAGMTEWEKFLKTKDVAYLKQEYAFQFSAIQGLFKKRTPYGNYMPAGLDMLNIKTGKKIPFIPHI